MAALAALLLQLAISFGHVHGLATGEPSSAAATHVVAAFSDPDDNSSAPAGPAHDDGYCAICAVIGLVGTGRLASAPAIPVRLDVLGVRIAVANEDLVAQPPSIAFRSRGPPLV